MGKMLNKNTSNSHILRENLVEMATDYSKFDLRMQANEDNS
jgi:hypothetical protein